MIDDDNFYQHAVRAAVAETELGKEIAYFGPSWPNILAGMIIALLVGTGGAILIWLAMTNFRWNMPIHVDKGMCWVAFVPMLLIGIALILAAFVGIYLLFSMTGLRVAMRENGLFFHNRHVSLPIFWHDIALIKEVHTFERPPILHFPAQLLLPEKESISFLVVHNQGQEFSFSATTVNEFAKFSELLIREATVRHVNWIVVEEHG